MTSIYKKELDGYFNGFTGYLFLAVSLAVIGIYTMANNVSAGYANFLYSLDSTAFIFTILIPILTMRTFAEERRSRTDLLLYSAPIGASEVVLGKFFAAATVWALPCLICCAYPPVFRAYGQVDLVSAYAGIFAFFLLGCVMIALGIFLSSMTESLIAAAVLSFGSLLVWLLLDSLVTFLPATALGSAGCWAALALLAALVLLVLTKSRALSGALAVLGCGGAAGGYLLAPTAMEGSFVRAMEDLSIFTRYSAFTDGVLDLTTLVYYLSLTALFLFFTGISVEKRRWS